ncbi:MAG: carboxypeptidase-like regulatory domain-containing protein [Crocinitomicaceae bacterium]|nr:carboxypeptidase-like regulatory domain-containing protein [Crocinitomicaceae bacterium]
MERKISVDVVDLKLVKVLQIIEQKAYFKFSYNSTLIEESKLITLKVQDETVAKILYKIFGDEFRYKEAGNHLILLKNQETSNEDVKQKFYLQFSGQIIDAYTGKPLSGVSIYDVESRKARLSDENGAYKMTIESDEKMRGFYFSKVGYHDTTIVVHSDNPEINLELIPLNPEIEKLPGATISTIDFPVEQRPVSKIFVPQESFVHAENLKAIKETRIAQISFIPTWSIGSDLSTNGLMINRFSFNVLGGYANGVDGFELGGLFNIDKQKVRGLQIAGIGNIVGGTTSGLQIGGISNIVGDTTNGLQIGGINNVVRGHFYGVQISGISNVVTKGFDGFQIAGINNFVRTSSRGLQISGINNIVMDTLYGGQIAGIGNWARRGVNRCQISGIVNLAHINTGVQITGIYNHCRINDGMQIGLINSSISGSGAALGLVSYCKEGYRSTEFGANEVGHLQVNFKSGVNKLYNIYSLGVNFIDRSRIMVGLGLGTKWHAGKIFSVSNELISYLVQFENFNAFQGNQFHRYQLTFDFRFAKWFTLFIGPSANIGFSRTQSDEGEYLHFMNYQPLYEADFSDSQLQFWVGAQAGIRVGIRR